MPGTFLPRLSLQPSYNWGVCSRLAPLSNPHCAGKINSPFGTFRWHLRSCLGSKLHLLSNSLVTTCSCQPCAILRTGHSILGYMMSAGKTELFSYQLTKDLPLILIGTKLMCPSQIRSRPPATTQQVVWGVFTITVHQICLINCPMRDSSPSLSNFPYRGCSFSTKRKPSSLYLAHSSRLSIIGFTIPKHCLWPPCSILVAPGDT